jgi:hypothetical protein
VNDDFVWFIVDRHLDKMAEIIAEMHDEEVNRRPDLPGANSAYQIVFHSCAVLEWWTHSAILGKVVDRDRPAEFQATGTVPALLRRIETVRAQLLRDLKGMDLDAPLQGSARDEYADTPVAKSTGGVLLHMLEELAQHHGHLELTRDLVRRPTG